MAIQRSKDVKQTAPTFRVNINITLTGSKKMTPEDQEALMKGLDGVRIIVVHQDVTLSLHSDDLVLVDTIAPVKEFKTNSVGFGIQATGAEFKGSPA